VLWIVRISPPPPLLLYWTWKVLHPCKNATSCYSCFPPDLRPLSGWVGSWITRIGSDWIAWGLYHVCTPQAASCAILRKTSPSVHTRTIFDGSLEAPGSREILRPDTRYKLGVKSFWRRRRHVTHSLCSSPLLQYVENREPERMFRPGG